jgi:hypothetical protein
MALEFWIVLGAGLIFAVLAGLLPRVFVGRSQDRLARRLLAEEGGRTKLLTRAERVIGKYRRVPGVLGLTGDALIFESLFGESAVLPTVRIQKIVTGSRLSSGRRLLRLEVLRLVSTGGDELEFVVSRSSASAWRSHLGLWAVQERKAAMDTVTPGRR